MAHVLIVDDSPTDIYVLKRMLERNGHEASAVTTAEQGIAAARAQRPDIILMDVVMPGLNGFQATRQLSRDPQTARIPVIIVSTKNQDTDRIWGLRQGAREYVTKPVEEHELLGKIADLLDG